LKEIHSSLMKQALRQAERAFELGEVPVGCIIVRENKIIAKAYNQIETLKDPTAHAEMLALTSAFDALQNKILKGCSMYVTLEPCAMCAGALVLSKIDTVYFGSYDLKTGACGSVINITNNKSFNHKVKVYGGVLDTECAFLLKAFFESKRSGQNGYSVN